MAAPPEILNGAAQFSAADTERGPKWATLSGSQQSALKPLERDWRGIGPDHKQKWLEIAAQFPAMSVDERQRIQARMTEWATMTPQQRGAARLQFKQAQQLAPSNRQARWEAYQALPDEEKKQLASRAEPAASSGSALRRSRLAGTASRNSSDIQAKSNVVAVPETGRPVRSVAPTLVQAPNGATTTLISKRPTPPVHEQAGLPKITASPNFVNPSTLLPRRGPQGAAVIAASASAPLARP
ncbi:MAG: DUF3106 domain-containing protein [Burkholderiaceae bacterium]|nr:DUF3106 domain-containing protein [Burkholderiaceae bacterium]